MHPAARTLFAFGVYLCLLGPGLALAPHALLTPFGFEPALDPWARVCGLLATLIGAYYLLAARENWLPLVRASVAGRLAVAAALAGLVPFTDAPKALLLFAAVDAGTALWTAAALRRALRMQRA